MSIPLPDTKTLWARAGSRCTLCRQHLINITHGGKPALLGEAAHIIAEKADGPRGESILEGSERNSYFNLILLCPTCHTAIDKDPSSYPPERLHMMKAQHEMRQSGQVLPVQAVTSAAADYVKNDEVVKFAKEWASFVPFYAQFFSHIQLIQMDRKEETDELFLQAKEWHKRRDKLKELLFRAGEENTLVHRIPSWERLKNEHEYIRDGLYLTPFSFILDFVNPCYMVAKFSTELWAAYNISMEFMDYLRFKHPELAEHWALNE